MGEQETSSLKHQPIDDSVVAGEPCECEFTPYNDDDESESSTHYFRRCQFCQHAWYGLHCPHDGYQNPCENCGQKPMPVSESPVSGADHEAVDLEELQTLIRHYFQQGATGISTILSEAYNEIVHLRAQAATWEREKKELVLGLRMIAICEGKRDPDPFRHVQNIMKNMANLANELILKHTPGDGSSERRNEAGDGGTNNPT